MLGPSEFRELVSGRRRGPLATLARAALRLLEWPYAASVRWRNLRYDRGLALIVRVEVPVISVGNLTLGGTGKTPTIEWLARWFADQQVRVGLVSRGYGAKPGHVNDEALELARKLPDVPHVLDPDRAGGARQAIQKFGCRLVLLDDAFQHRRIARDLDIVLVDALEPDGFGHVFPRGTLREPLSGWNRADVVMLTRTELAGETERAAIRQRVREHAPEAIWVEATHAPQCLESASGERQSLDSLKGQRVAAFCGIGNPAGFRHALVDCGFQLADIREFADHFVYSRGDIEALVRWSDGLDVAAVLCTCKDLVKITIPWAGRAPLWAVSSRLQITHGQAEFERALRPLADRAKG
ncbi:MAG TPA: tetraacyldisaccharide 4'-kinase [Pirellulales bacterium]|nr:tetraacyldisaccharide 4'-kinase [Pirellulales bacterium]